MFLYHLVKFQLFLETLISHWSSQNYQKKQLTRMYLSSYSYHACVYYDGRVCVASVYIYRDPHAVIKTLTRNSHFAIIRCSQLKPSTCSTVHNCPYPFDLVELSPLHLLSSTITINITAVVVILRT